MRSYLVLAVIAFCVCAVHTDNTEDPNNAGQGGAEEKENEKYPTCGIVKSVRDLIEQDPYRASRSCVTFANKLSAEIKRLQNALIAEAMKTTNRNQAYLERLNKTISEMTAEDPVGKSKAKCYELWDKTGRPFIPNPCPIN